MEPLVSVRLKEYGDRVREEGIRLGIEHQGIERGIEQGLEDQRALLRSLTARKFGAVTAGRALPLLAKVSESERLAQVGGWIIECGTGEELLDRVQVLTRSAQR